MICIRCLKRMIPEQVITPIEGYLDNGNGVTIGVQATIWKCLDCGETKISNNERKRIIKEFDKSAKQIMRRKYGKTKRKSN